MSTAFFRALCAKAGGRSAGLAAEPEGECVVPGGPDKRAPRVTIGVRIAELLLP